MEDSYNIPKVDFCPLRTPGPHFPLDEVNALSLFELFFDDAVMDCILKCTFAYAEGKKNEKKEAIWAFYEESNKSNPFLVHLYFSGYTRLGTIANHGVWGTAS